MATDNSNIYTIAATTTNNTSVGDAFITYAQDAVRYTSIPDTSWKYSWTKSWPTDLGQGQIYSPSPKRKNDLDSAIDSAVEELKGLR